MPGAPVISGSVSVVGLFGKLPAAGDFVRRRLSAETVSDLDCWLQMRLAEVSRAWRDEDAKALRFLATAGVFGSAALVGVMAPSRDRVGRRFPLIVASEVYPSVIDRYPLALDWFDLVEAEMAPALAGDLGAEALEKALLRLPPALGANGEGFRVYLKPCMSCWWRVADLKDAEITPAAPDAATFETLVEPWLTATAAYAAEASLADDDMAPSAKGAQS
ncbi:hypothetical protein BH11PSE2_BH11PSE2_19280 [soil metagenome]